MNEKNNTLDFDFGLSVDLDTKTTSVDLSKYRALVEVTDASEEEIMELLRLTYQLVEELVDYGWGRSPVQIACGQIEETDCQSGETGHNVLHSKPSSLKERFNAVTAE